MNELALFAGAGGGLLGSILLGWRTIGAVEIEEYPCRVLEARQRDGCLEPFPIFNMDVRNVTRETVDSAVNLWYASTKAIQEVDMPAHRKNYDEAVRMYEAGLSIRDVADFYGVTRSAMYKILKRRDVSFRPQKRHGEENHFYRGGPFADRDAQRLTERAIGKGVLVPPSHCSRCGEAPRFVDERHPIQAHHDDYNKPLDVRWLCQPCHHEWHKNNRPKKRKEVRVDPEGMIDIVSGGFP